MQVSQQSARRTTRIARPGGRLMLYVDHSALDYSYVIFAFSARAAAFIYGSEYCTDHDESKTNRMAIPAQFFRPFDGLYDGNVYVLGKYSGAQHDSPSRPRTSPPGCRPRHLTRRRLAARGPRLTLSPRRGAQRWTTKPASP